MEVLHNVLVTFQTILVVSVGLFLEHELSGKSCVKKKLQCNSTYYTGFYLYVHVLVWGVNFYIRTPASGSYIGPVYTRVLTQIQPRYASSVNALPNPGLTQPHPLVDWNSVRDQK